MNRAPDEFEALQKLLAMKRHEQPPPRFFAEFAEKVLTRLDVPEAVGPLTWRQRLGLDFDLKPALVCASGVGLLSVLIFGLFTSLHIDRTVVPGTQIPIESHPLTPPRAMQGPPPGMLHESLDPVADFRRFTASVKYYPGSGIPQL